MSRVIIEFPDEASATSFLGWWADGGGEQFFFEADEIYAGREEKKRKPIGRFTYDRAFPAWGYDPRKHGPDRTVTAHFKTDEK